MATFDKFQNTVAKAVNSDVYRKTLDRVIKVVVVVAVILGRVIKVVVTVAVILLCVALVWALFNSIGLSLGHLR